MTDSPKNEISAGVSISGHVGHVGGDIVGRDKTVVSLPHSTIDATFRAVSDIVAAAPPNVLSQAGATLGSLKSEVAKGRQSEDGIVAKLVDGLVSLVPGAASAVVSAFASPLLSGVAGPVTKYILDGLRANLPGAKHE